MSDKTKDTDDRKWGWMIRGEDTAEGPFDTREEALEDAHAKASGRPIGVGRITWPSARSYAPNAIEFLTSMEQAARSDGFVGDEIFDADEKTLEQQLADLAAGYVGSVGWTLKDVDWEDAHIHLWHHVSVEGTSWELCSRCGQGRRLG